MNKLDILTFPDPRLRKKAQPIERFDENLKDMAEKMLHTMYADKGIGLAATQVNYHERLIVIDVSENQDEPIYIVNPSYEVLDSSLSRLKKAAFRYPHFSKKCSEQKKLSCLIRI